MCCDDPWVPRVQSAGGKKGRVRKLMEKECKGNHMTSTQRKMMKLSMLKRIFFMTVATSICYKSDGDGNFA